MRPFWQAVGNLIRDPQSPYPSLGLQPAKSEPRDGFTRGVTPVVAWAGGTGRSPRQDRTTLEKS
jgi:hypothetical protein